MQIGQTGVDLIKSFEGCRLTGYICPAGVPTIGYGYTGKMNGKTITTATRITQQQAEALLQTDLVRYVNHVMTFNSNYNWNQNEFDAMVSFAYNVGSINQLTVDGKRTKAQIATAMLQYNKGGGKVLAGLTRRRKAERDLFLKPVIEEVDTEMAETSKMIVNGKEVTVRCILRDSTNYIAIRDVGNALGYEVSAKGNIPVLAKK